MNQLVLLRCENVKGGSTDPFTFQNGIDFRIALIINWQPEENVASTRSVFQSVRLHHVPEQAGLPAWHDAGRLLQRQKGQTTRNRIQP